MPGPRRRKIHDEDVRRPTEMTQEALRRIAELYDIEAEIRGSPAEERLAVRKARSPVDAVIVRLDTVAEENVETCGDGEGVRLYPESLECAERVLS